jgi:hypothetical protein
MIITAITGQSPPAELAKFQNNVDKLGNILNEKSFPKSDSKPEQMMLPPIAGKFWRD